MKKISLNQCLAIIALVVFVVYGWLYLTENRYMEHHATGVIIDTWTQKVVPMEDLLPKE